MNQLSSTMWEDTPRAGARFQCQFCKTKWLARAGPADCPKCLGRSFVKWMNFKAMRNNFDE